MMVCVSLRGRECVSGKDYHDTQEKIRLERQPTYHLILLLLAAREKDASCDASFYFKLNCAGFAYNRRHSVSRIDPRQSPESSRACAA